MTGDDDEAMQAALRAMSMRSPTSTVLPDPDVATHVVPSESALERSCVDGRDVVVLYRPTGSAELALVEASHMRRWPPRLEEQPIFYPVTNERYAEEIASGWNLADEERAFVTRFHVEAATALAYPVQIVGARHHAELWVPADELDALNDAIVGPIEVVRRLARSDRC